MLAYETLFNQRFTLFISKKINNIMGKGDHSQRKEKKKPKKDKPPKKK